VVHVVAIAELCAAHVRAHLMPPRASKGAPLADVHGAALHALSVAFTSARERLPAGYLQRPELRAAYLLYYVPVGVATLHGVIERAGIGARIGTVQRLRVLDLGAGPLTASLALAALLPPGAELEVVAIDGSSAALRDGVALLADLRPTARATTITGNLRDARTLRSVAGRFDLIVCLSVLNEWHQGGRKALGPGPFVAHLMRERLVEDGIALLVEPGTRAGSHGLIEVREHVLAGAAGHAWSPCMGQMPCPLADASMRDWCHGEMPWRRPRVVAELDHAIDHRRATLKASHLVLGLQPPPQRDGWRVIGGPMQQGATWRRYLCGPGGRVTARVPTARLAEHAELRDAWRGERVRATGTLYEDAGEAVFDLSGPQLASDRPPSMHRPTDQRSHFAHLMTTAKREHRRGSGRSPPPR
jgi:SAM-dependent methyltransferase